MPRFVRLLDAAKGDFSDVIEATEAPRPLTIEDASTLDAYVRSYWEEVFDWTAADGLDPRPEFDLRDPDDLDLCVSEAEDVVSGWQIRILARLEPASAVKALFGEHFSCALF